MKGKILATNHFISHFILKYYHLHCKNFQKCRNSLKQCSIWFVAITAIVFWIWTYLIVFRNRMKLGSSQVMRCVTHTHTTYTVKHTQTHTFVYIEIALCHLLFLIPWNLYHTTWMNVQYVPRKTVIYWFVYCFMPKSNLYSIFFW